MGNSMGTLTGPTVRRPWEEFIKEENFVPPSEKDKEIGHGGFAFVYKAQLDGHIVAAKELKWIKGLQNHSADYLEKMYEKGNQLYNVQREICVHAGLNHPNIVKLLGVTAKWKGRVLIPEYILLEYISGGTLKGKSVNLQNPDAKCLHRVLTQLEGVASALDYLHTRTPPVLHRDIKPQNVLVTSLGEAKLADLGLAKPYDANMADTKGTPGTWQYTAPEVVTQCEEDQDTVRQDTVMQYTVKSDMFSFGMTALVLLGLRPSARHNRLELDKQALLIADQHYMLGLGAELLACISEDPTKRPTAGTIKKALSKYRKFCAELPQKKAILRAQAGMDYSDFLDNGAVHLVLDNLQFTEDEAKALVAVLEEKRGLKELCVRSCQLPKASLRDLVGTLPNFQDLKVVSFSYLQSLGTDKEWASHLITVLPRMHGLEVLELKSNNLGEAIVRSLAGSLQRLPLKRLDLSDNGIEKVDTVTTVINSLPPRCDLIIANNSVQKDEARRALIKQEWSKNKGDLERGTLRC